MAFQFSLAEVSHPFLVGVCIILSLLMKCSREQEILPLLGKKKQDCYLEACMKMMHSTCTPAEALTKLTKSVN